MRDFALRTTGAEGEERIRGHEGIMRLGGIKACAAQQHESTRAGIRQPRGEGFRRVRRGDFVDERSHCA